MASFEYVEGSYQEFPEDEYTKESVTICLEGKYRVTYIRKMLNTGGMFWSVVSSGVKKDGKKVFLLGFEADSNFLNKDIIKYLNDRSWESKSVFTPKSMKEVNSDELPF